MSASRRLKTSCANIVIPSHGSWRNCQQINLWTYGAITIKMVRNVIALAVCCFHMLRRGEPWISASIRLSLAAQCRRHKPLCQVSKVIKTEQYSMLFFVSTTHFTPWLALLFCFPRSSIKRKTFSHETRYFWHDNFAFFFHLQVKRVEWEKIFLSRYNQRSIFRSTECEINNFIGRMMRKLDLEMLHVEIVH